MKKISCVIFSVMLVVFSLMPVTAFAGTGAANVDYRSIAKDYDIGISDDYTYYAVYTLKDKTDFVYCIFSNNPVVVLKNGGYGFCTVKGSSAACTLVRYPYSNVYSNAEALASNKYVSYGDWATYMGSATGKVDTTVQQYDNASPLIFAYSNFDVDNVGETFTQTSSTGQGQSQTGKLVLGPILKNTQLSQVLSELIAVLPILLPVLITFIAIRKGIKFILSQLRAA